MAPSSIVANIRAPPEPERMIVVVTGANAGIGLGICHRLLSALSLPTSQTITEALPQSSAFDPSLSSPSFTSSHTSQSTRPPIHLTLILACRSLKKAQTAKEEILERHLKVLGQRRRKGWEEPEGWREGLRIEIELVDTDSPMGENGILDFCERLRQRYPYITTLFSNAGVHAAVGHPRWGAMILEIIRRGPFYALSHDKAFMDEEIGRLSRDKKRGAIWGINTFATYLLANELLPLLRRSPTSLPFSPRTVYTSSGTTELSDFERSDCTDRQLRSFRKVYAPSKYAGDLLINDFDRRYGSSDEEGRGVRAIAADPGCVVTNAAKDSLVDSPLFGLILFANSLVFALLRLLGSPWHPRDTQDCTAALLYAALVPDEYLPPCTTSTRWKFWAHSHPFRDTTPDYMPLDGGETPLAEEILQGQLEECEKVRQECKQALKIDN